MNCYYCDQIHASSNNYAPHDAEFDLGSHAPRCQWHWRLICDCCGEAGHFMTRFYCPRSGRLLCQSVGAVSYAAGPFWAWQEAWWINCPDCNALHPSLDRAEFEACIRGNSIQWR